MRDGKEDKLQSARIELNGKINNALNNNKSDIVDVKCVSETKVVTFTIKKPELNPFKISGTGAIDKLYKLNEITALDFNGHMAPLYSEKDIKLFNVKAGQKFSKQTLKMTIGAAFNLAVRDNEEKSFKFNKLGQLIGKEIPLKITAKTKDGVEFEETYTLKFVKWQI